MTQSITRSSSIREGVPSVIVFDVNETLIDIDSLAPLFERMFGDPKVLREWFNQLILYSNAITLAGYYETFFTLGQGVLKMLGAVYDAPVKQADLEELRTRMLSMPAHKEVPEGLQLLRDAGFLLMTLTNSPPDKDGSPLERAGLSHLIERQFSVESVRRFKPAPEVYSLVSELLEVTPSSICLVAAHTWDTLGAQSVGFSAGLITRTGNALLPVAGLPQPQVVASDLVQLAKQMVTLWRRPRSALMNLRVGVTRMRATKRETNSRQCWSSVADSTDRNSAPLAAARRSCQPARS